VFPEANLAGLHGHLGIRHTRYSNTGSTQWTNAQPFHRQVGATSVALAHNGNLTNTRELAETLGTGEETSDSALMVEAIARRIDDERSDDRGLEKAMGEALPTCEGAFALGVMDQGRGIAARAPHGFRPLCLGELPEGGWVLASETSALDLVGATFRRDVEPGEMVVIDATGIRSRRPFEATDPRLCIFEYVY